MARKRGPAVPAKVKAVRARIERWRRTRKNRSRMPEELWGAAVGLARVYGVYRVARALKVSYETLKRRTSESEKAKGSKEVGSGAFVEVDAGQFGALPTPTATVVELTDGDGAKLMIRLPGSAHVDVVELVNGFWGRDS